MKKLLCGAIALCLTGGILAAPASVSGTVDFEVDIPEILVLYHWDKARLNVNSLAGQFVYEDDNSGTLREGDVNLGATSADITVGGLDGLSPVPPGFQSANLITVTLVNSWAVRSISSGDVSLDIAINDGDHVNGASKAVVSNASVSQTTIPSSWNPTTGNIEFKLNLSEVTVPGLHESSGDTFELTLTGN